MSRPPPPLPFFFVIRLVLYQPDIAQNAGAMMRLAACMGISLDLVEPCGFPFDDRRVRRAGMDYLDMLNLTRHASWARFQETASAGRLILLTTAGEARHDGFAFQADDRIVVGRESAGAPPEVHLAADARVRIPMRAGVRSLNVAQAAAIGLSEALRQTGQLPA